MRAVFLLVVGLPIISFARGLVCSDLFQNTHAYIQELNPGFSGRTVLVTEPNGRKYIRKEYGTTGYARNDIVAFQVLGQIAKQTKEFRITQFYKWNGKVIEREYAEGELLTQYKDNPRIQRRLHSVLNRIEHWLYRTSVKSNFIVREIEYIKDNAYPGLPSLYAKLEDNQGRAFEIWIKPDNILMDRQLQFVIFDPF